MSGFITFTVERTPVRYLISVASLVLRLNSMWYARCLAQRAGRLGSLRTLQFVTLIFFFVFLLTATPATS